ncbi:LysR family transcriptional regulator [Candidatus Epulonipiscium fishelsonii]|uniref:LysR family transcriptional regulator n=1 Tax=Candidatus Epulonipiscium fishelsonii TaxID=77094 RepID=A0ACC8XG73_9FIRM|nr:LysR family transcriptional regulator [Epulopiscium sp. SCG-B05WGA-EpuloA1]ONI42362.1 LysR family transcriptional regulator [Epulopiscium sp. SCG-B11WGA-EpuloA1]
MDFKELNYVLAIAKYQNITKASQHLFISQPSLSNFIKTLEKALGVKLFNKIGNRFVLTYAGECYVEKAKSILILKEELDLQLSDIVYLNQGRLNLAMPFTRGLYLIPSTLPKFSSLYPKIKINILEGNTQDLEKMILTGEADIAILNGPIHHNNLEFEKLHQEEIVLVTSKNHPLANQRVILNKFKYPWIDLNLFRKDTFILQYPFQYTGQIAYKIFKQQKFTPNSIFQIQSLATSLKMVEAGMGICFMSEFYLKHLFSDINVAYFSIGQESISFDLIVAHRKSSYLPLYIKDFTQIIRSVL